jgi:hypothetical protein
MQAEAAQAFEDIEWNQPYCQILWEAKSINIQSLP